MTGPDPRRDIMGMAPTSGGACPPLLVVALRSRGAGPGHDRVWEHRCQLVASELTRLRPERDQTFIPGRGCFEERDAPSPRRWPAGQASPGQNGTSA